MGRRMTPRLGWVTPLTAGDVMDGLDRLTPQQGPAVERVVRVMAGPTWD
jgi:hypothetical protein